MWVLECAGDALSNCRLWMKPGVEYVVGRSSHDTSVNLVIPEKSVSRVHLKIKVGEVPEGNGLRTLSRSQITLEGQKTLHGTKVDGEPLGSGETRLLGGTEHILNLGKYGPVFRIKWKPIVFSFSLSSKEKNDKKTMLQRQSKVEQYDMKTLETFVPSTTHVVASKRNTAIGLQALVNGRYIVTEDYLDAVARACQSVNGGKSALEADFVKNWPDPMDYLPASSNEPIRREKEYFAPNSERQGIFEGWTFVFCEKVQYENFLGLITDGGGKLEKYNLIPGETTARRLVDFIEKRDKGNTAVIRFRGKGDTEEWCARLSTEVSQILNLRMIEQNEFLDIILTGDTSQFLRPLEEEGPATPPPTMVGLPNIVPTKNTKMGPPPLPVEGLGSGEIIMEDAAPDSKLEASQVSRRRLGRILATNSAKIQIHDLFSMPGDPLPPPNPPPVLPSFTLHETQYHGYLPEAGEQYVLVDDLPMVTPSTHDAVVPTHSQMQSETPKSMGPQSLKRRSPDPDQDLDLMNKLFPGAAAMKKRRIQREEDEVACRSRSAGGDEAVAETAPTGLEKPDLETQDKLSGKSLVKGKRSKPENSILIAAREVMEEEQKKTRGTEDENEEIDEAILNLKNPGVVETFELKQRAPTTRVNAYGEEGDRWDPMWNGRPNFKKFRKRLHGTQDGDENHQMRSVRGNVIIPLVEHKSGSGSVFSHGFPDSQSQQRSTSDPEPEEDGLEELSVFGVNSRRSRTKDPAYRAPTETCSSQTLSGSSNNVETESIGSRMVGCSVAAKRGLPENATPAGPAEKRVKKFFLRREDSESSEDGLKFTFKKRGK